jgi:hypothetical protein
MAGERVSVVSGLAFAVSRFRAIVVWTLVASSIGILLQLLAERLGWLGRLVLVLVGISWSAAATFVIPVIIREESANPLTLLKASASTIRKTWGESVFGYVELQSGAIPLMIVLAVLFRSVRATTDPTLFILIATIIAIFAIWLTIINTARAVYRCALYVYATEGVVPEPYSAELMDSAWSVKKLP